MEKAIDGYYSCFVEEDLPGFGLAGYGDTAENAKKDMASMLDYIDKLGELDTTGVEPMSHIFPVSNVMREDEVTNGDGSEATLRNAPERNDEAFIVPKTVE